MSKTMTETEFVSRMEQASEDQKGCDYLCINDNAMAVSDALGTLCKALYKRLDETAEKFSNYKTISMFLHAASENFGTKDHRYIRQLLEDEDERIVFLRSIFNLGELNNE